MGVRFTHVMLSWRRVCTDKSGAFFPAQLPPLSLDTVYSGELIMYIRAPHAAMSYGALYSVFSMPYLNDVLRCWRDNAIYPCPWTGTLYGPSGR